MKKISVFFLSLICLLCFCSCGAKQEEIVDGIRIYYLDSSETTLMNEVHELKGTTTKEKIVEALTLLGETPESREMKASIAGGITIVNYAYEENIVSVSLGSKYLDLSRTTSVLTRAAIVKTLSQIEGVDGVILTVEGEPLTDSEGATIGLMTGDMFLDEDDDRLGEYQKITIRLYFTNEEGNVLVPIDRRLVHNLDLSNISLEKLVIEQLLAGPASDDSCATINPETKLLSVSVKDGICYVNFDSAIYTPVNNVSSDVVIYSIVNTLVELNGVNKVQISIDGKKDVKFRDKYDLTTIFEKNYELIQ